MKKKGLLVVSLLAVCLLLTGCGKKVQTLTCSQEEDGAKMEMVIKYDTKKFEFKEMTMEMTMPKELYKDLGKSDDELEKMVCEDDDFKSEKCEAKVKDDKLVAKYEFNAEKEGKDMLEEEDLKAGKDTLEDLKKSAEDDGYKCTIK